MPLCGVVYVAFGKGNEQVVVEIENAFHQNKQIVCKISMVGAERKYQNPNECQLIYKLWAIITHIRASEKVYDCLRFKLARVEEDENCASV